MSWFFHKNNKIINKSINNPINKEINNKSIEAKKEEEIWNYNDKKFYKFLLTINKDTWELLLNQDRDILFYRILQLGNIKFTILMRYLNSKILNILINNEPIQDKGLLFKKIANLPNKQWNVLLNSNNGLFKKGEKTLNNKIIKGPHYKYENNSFDSDMFSVEYIIFQNMAEKNNNKQIEFAKYLNKNISARFHEFVLHVIGAEKIWEKDIKNLQKIELKLQNKINVKDINKDIKEDLINRKKIIHEKLDKYHEMYPFLFYN